MLARSSAILVLPALAALAPALAQQRDTAPPAARGDSLGRPAVLGPVVVTGTAVPLRADRLGFALTVVPARDLAVEPRPYAADALRHLPGAFIDEAAGPGGPTIVRLRGGEEVFTQILMDGVPMNQNGGFFDFQGLTLANVGRIEVARGPQSALYGSSAVSGVVQFITPPGEIGAPRLDVSTEGGLSDGPGGTFQGGGRLRGGGPRFRYSLGAGATFNRGIYPLPNDTWTRDGVLRLDLAPAERWFVTAHVRFIGVDSKLPVRDPGATRVPLDPNAHSERDRLVTAIKATFDATPAWAHQLTAALYREAFLYVDQRDNVDTGGQYPFFVFDADFALRSTLWRTTASYGASHRLTGAASDEGATLSYGAQWEREDLADRTSGEFGTGELPLARSSGAVYSEIQAPLGDRANFLAGIRLDKFEGLRAELTPRASLVVNLVRDAVRLRGAAGQAYKAPNLQQQYLDNPFIASNPDLLPETSFSWELGAELHVGGRASIGVTYFNQGYRDLIRTVTQEGTSKQINRNLGSARAEGIEWSARYSPRAAWTAGVDGTWLMTVVRDNTGLADAEFPEGEALPFRPGVVSSAFLELAPRGRLTARARVTYVGSQTVLTERFSGARVDLDAYVLAGLTIGLDLTDRLGVYGRLENAFDQRYATAFDRPGIRRTAALGLRMRATE